MDSISDEYDTAISWRASKTVAQDIPGIATITIVDTSIRHRRETLFRLQIACCNECKLPTFARRNHGIIGLFENSSKFI
ncbi:hypothetical protein [Burkholderia sp. BCC0405]|uniref:hypothetical protein n=1 Tax=Burkholderia sp. BCC0405 TaxID=2676298 RepID=UPI0015884EE7|nr:hypothetical protein [Burkholderia sp. BCC0405]